jgi:pyruvate kinase
MNARAPQVVATIGPSCQSVDMLVKLLEDGMSAARVDLTWGPIEYHRRSLDNLQARSAALPRWRAIAGPRPPARARAARRTARLAGQPRPKGAA